MNVLKTIKTVLLSTSILSSILIGILTGTIWYNSLSATDIANATGDALMFLKIYTVMHLSAVAFFFLHGFTRKNWLDIVVGGLMFGIWYFDMYEHYILHVFFTVSTLLVAIFNMIKNAYRSQVYAEIFMSAVAAFMFLIGYFTSLHFMVGEIVAMWCVGVGYLRSVHVR